MAQAGATRSGTAVCGRPPGRRQTSCAMTLPIGVEAVSFRYPDGTQALEDVDLLVERAVYAALESVGLTDQADTNPYDLGYSRRKLLALASILAMRTPIVVLDE